MVEVFERQDIERFEASKEVGGVSSNRKYKSRAKNVKGLILGLISKFRDDSKKGIIYTPLELQKVWEEAFIRFNELYGKRLITLEIIGWKGKDSSEIYKGFDDDFRVIEYRKNKQTGEIDKSEPFIIEKEFINHLIRILRTIDVGKHYGARYFWKKIIEYYRLNKEGVDLLNFNGGGSQRAKYYFRYYYHPAQVLEKIGIMRLVDGKGGGIVRLK